LLNIDPVEWIEAIEGQEGFMKSYGSRMPKSMWDQHNELAKRIHLIGYRTRPAKHGFEIEGVSDEVLKRFSKRSQEVAKAVREIEQRLGHKLSNNAVALAVHHRRVDDPGGRVGRNRHRPPPGHLQWPAKRFRQAAQRFQHHRLRVADRPGRPAPQDRRGLGERRRQHRQQEQSAGNPQRANRRWRGQTHLVLESSSVGAGFNIPQGMTARHKESHRKLSFFRRYLDLSASTVSFLRQIEAISRHGAGLERPAPEVDTGPGTAVRSKTLTARGEAPAHYEIDSSS